jgi:dTDP-4-dehydrorhamnose 3,5-epimerase
MSAASVQTQRFEFEALPLAGMWLARQKPIGDHRGFFSRFYCTQEFSAIGMTMPLSQINHSMSRLHGTVRGLHFQHPPHEETKVVTCLRGRIFDVAVDIRRGSPTFLQWFGIELSEVLHASLVIPPGFAHGYQTLTDQAEILYLVTPAYSATAEDGLNPFDPAIGIQWPEPVTDLSERDRLRPLVAPGYAGIGIGTP